MPEISKAILDGRKLVENLRSLHQEFYSQALGREELTQEHIRLKEMERGIGDFGFADMMDFYEQSKEADMAAGLEVWR